MPNTPTSSFIPKQGPAKRSRQIVSRQVHLFTVLSYIFFFGALLASAGVFFYQRHTENQLRNEVVALNSVIANFSEEKMEQVKAFNTRLIMAKERLQNSVSTASIFDSMEESTAASVALEKLTIKRNEDESITLTATVNTNTFDSALFQRGLYERNPIIESVSFKDVGLGETNTEIDVVSEGISFEAELKVPLVRIPYTPSGTIIPVTENTVFELSTTTDVTSTSSGELPGNQTSL